MLFFPFFCTHYLTVFCIVSISNLPVALFCCLIVFSLCFSAYTIRYKTCRTSVSCRVLLLWLVLWSMSLPDESRQSRSWEHRVLQWPKLWASRRRRSLSTWPDTSNSNTVKRQNQWTATAAIWERRRSYREFLWWFWQFADDYVKRLFDSNKAG